MTFVPPETGIYYLVTAVCDYHVSPLTMTGNMVVENPYGHLPAPQYGSLPFYSLLCVLYVVALFVWIMWCVKYSSEVMSVQIVILVCEYVMINDNDYHHFNSMMKGLLIRLFSSPSSLTTLSRSSI